MVSRGILFWTILFCYTMTSNAEELPDFVIVCKKTNPELELCLKDSIESLKKRLMVGLPEFKIEPLEPLQLADLIISDKIDGKGLKITSHDTKVYGALSFILKRVRVIKHAKNYKINLVLPNLTSRGVYKAEGRLFYLPVNGKGNFAGNFTGVIGEIDIKFGNKIVNGTSRILVTKIDCKFSVKNGRLRLENIFGGRDQVLADLMNLIINENFNSYADATIPLLTSEFARIVRKAANRFLVRFTEDQLFP